MKGVSLDTSFLISFADPKRIHHEIAVSYFKHCIAKGIPMWISTVAAGEFHVGQAFTDLPLQNFRIQPYNLPHAIRAGELLKLLNAQAPEGATDARRVIINDIKIIAQAAEERIGVILSEDKGTLARIASRIRIPDIETPRVILLAEGFTPERLSNADQDELSFPSE
jgi:predicted nucleic acid-binding protein